MPYKIKRRGIGTHSVKCIAEKYNGTVSFMDMGESFEACAVLYGIKSEFELQSILMRHGD